MDNSLTYKNAGVDTEAARESVDDIAALRSRTETSRRLHQAFGLFAASFDLSGYRHPMILTACDGVGTKIMPLLDHDMPEVAGIDLVAMNVNDILTANAMPLLFLDYVGLGRIDRKRLNRLITGMADALEGCDCILAGGETAEMPDLVPDGQVELAGFCVGAAERAELLDPSTVRPGDTVLGIPSAGFHANGWSLIRKIWDRFPDTFSEEDRRALLAPTRIYYPEVAALRKAGLRPRAMAHITGGGIRENLQRVLGSCGASLSLPRWEAPAVEKVLQAVDPAEAVHAFNMGIGWMIITRPEEADACRDALPEARVLGAVTDSGTIDIEVPS